MKAVIFANGVIKDYEKHVPFVQDAGLVICCDGGLKHADAMGVKPDYIVGDFDSVDFKLFEKYISTDGVEAISFKREKDETDAELAMLFAIKKKPSEIVVLGAMGNRFDHSLVNVHILIPALDSGIDASLVNENNVVRLTDYEITLNRRDGVFVSLIPLTTEVGGIVTSGLKYKLDDESLVIGGTRGISNEFALDEATVKIRSGILIVMECAD